MDQVTPTHKVSGVWYLPISEKIGEETNTPPCAVHTRRCVLYRLSQKSSMRHILWLVIIALRSLPRAGYINVTLAVDDYRRGPGMQTITIKQVFRETRHVSKLH